MTTDELLDKMKDLDPAAYCDADKSVRVMSPSLRRINPGKKLLGIARTVRCCDDFLSIIEALDQSVAGEVLVIDTQGTQRAVVGELFSLEASRRGLSGIVIDGACRDTETLVGLDLPVYACHTTPVSGTVQRLFETQGAIVCGGVEVNPGEIIFGDLDGVIVLNEEEAKRLLDQAQNIKKTEQRVIAAMASGTSLIDLTNFKQHAEALRSGDSGSRLQFKDRD
ncbi:MAG: RraA family protein [Gammaproteobacteria bacterium]